MIVTMRLVFAIILVAILAVSGWASSEIALWKTPREVLAHPWFIATLFDAYFAFLTFWLWLAYKERSWLSRLAWLVGILVLGNIAMATYVLIQLFRLRPDAKLEELLLRRS
jgi:hypothetical protein